jgi:hypothetical protein
MPTLSAATGQGLVPHGLPGGEINHGLEDRVEGVRGDDGVNFVLQLLHLPALRQNRSQHGGGHDTELGQGHQAIRQAASMDR